MTVQTSWDNHYRIGYDKRWFDFRLNASDNLAIELTSCGRKPQGLVIECANNARLMVEKYGKSNIAILYSGGCDSEIALLSFYAIGVVPKKVVFLDYCGENEYDRINAIAFCKYYNIRLEFIQMPAREMLLSGESVEICSRYQCAQAGLSFYLKAIEQLSRDYYIVTGDDPYIELMTNPLTGDKQWFFFAREAFYSLWKAFNYNDADGCPNFIQYTPESFVSFWDDPVMVWLRSQTQFNHSNSVKYSLYNQRFFTKQRGKSTGMEWFYAEINTQNFKILEKYPLFSMDELKYPFDKMYSELTCNIPND